MEIARKIDHTLLKSDCSENDIKVLCEAALKNNFKAVCIPPYFVKYASNMLQDSETSVATVIGYPLGYSATPAKVAEIRRAIDEGVDELDVVLNYSAVKSGDWNYVRNDIDSMTMAAHLKGKIIKVILGSSLMTKEELSRLCSICMEIGVNYVQTSTGYGENPTVETVRFLNQQLEGKIKIKALGGVNSKEDVEKLLSAGASRVGSYAGFDLG